MNDIMKEKFLIYKNILKLDDMVDIDILIIKYQDALSDYYDDINNISKLNLIMEAFCYFSDFNLMENNFNKLIDKYFELRLKDNKDLSCYPRSELIYMQSMLIATRLLENAVEIMDEKQIKDFSDPLCKLFSIYETIEKYEKAKNNTQKTKSIN